MQKLYCLVPLIEVEYSFLLMYGISRDSQGGKNEVQGSISRKIILFFHFFFGLSYGSRDSHGKKIKYRVSISRNVKFFSLFVSVQSFFFKGIGLKFFNVNLGSFLTSNCMVIVVLLSTSIQEEETVLVENTPKIACQGFGYFIKKSTALHFCFSFLFKREQGID